MTTLHTSESKCIQCSLVQRFTCASIFAIIITYNIFRLDVWHSCNCQCDWHTRAHVASLSSHKSQTLQGILAWRKHRFLIAIGRELAHISRRMSFLMARLHTKRHENRFKCRIKPRKLFISNVLPSFRFVFLVPPQMTCNFRKIPTRPLVGVLPSNVLPPTMSCRRRRRVGKVLSIPHDF